MWMRQPPKGREQRAEDRQFRWWAHRRIPGHHNQWSCPSSYRSNIQWGSMKIYFFQYQFFRDISPKFLRNKRRRPKKRRKMRRRRTRVKLISRKKRKRRQWPKCLWWPVLPPQTYIRQWSLRLRGPPRTIAGWVLELGKIQHLLLLSLYIFHKICFK